MEAPNSEFKKTEELAGLKLNAVKSPPRAPNAPAIEV